MKVKRFVYVLKEKGTTFYRIGSTHSYDYRKKILRQGNPRDLELLYIEEFDDPFVVMEIEKRIQKLYKEYHIKDSWFNIPNIDEVSLGCDLMRFRMEHELSELKKRHEYEKERYWNKEYCRIKEAS